MTPPSSPEPGDSLLKSETRERLEAWLEYAEDLNLGPFYRDRLAAGVVQQAARESEARPAPVAAATPRPLATLPPAEVSGNALLRKPTSASLFDAVDRIENDTLERIREDLGDCTRCRLHVKRTKIVFGAGNPRADLVFVGEGPGHDEDVQGLPFVGRAGKLLTQMIEAMGLKRDDVYICNVVKCRPPENRTPEKDEMATCSPFLFRQLDAIRPKVIVCLGSVATQALLQTTESLSRFRGRWLDYRNSKLMVTYHPAYLLRNPSAKGEVWKDLQKVMAELGLKPRNTPAAR